MDDIAQLIFSQDSTSLNWPKLLGLYADDFSRIFLPECVPCTIPHMFQ